MRLNSYGVCALWLNFIMNIIIIYALFLCVFVELRKKKICFSVMFFYYFLPFLTFIFKPVFIRSLFIEVHWFSFLLFSVFCFVLFVLFRWQKAKTLAESQTLSRGRIMQSSRFLVISYSSFD